MKTGKRFISVVIAVAVRSSHSFRCTPAAAAAEAAPAAGSTALVISTGAMTKGSVILNSVHFTADTRALRSRIDDTPESARNGAAKRNDGEGKRQDQR